MTQAHRFFQNLVIFGSVVPLAILLGYLIVVPPDVTTLGTFALVFLVLSFPLLIRWHHPLLIAAWNMGFVIPLRGSPKLWFLLAFLSLGMVIVRRTMGKGFRLQNVPSLTAPLLFLGCVVVGTAMLRGGIGLGAFGSEVGGGKRYLFIIAAIVGYFALSSQRIPEEKAKKAIVIFLLGGLSLFVGYLVPYIPQSFYFIFSFFPPETQGLEMVGETIVRADELILRSNVLTGAFTCVVKALLAYYGLRILLNLRRPWLTALWAAAVVMSFIGGFRSAFLIIAGLFCILFLLEGLLKTRIFIFTAILGTIAALAIVSFSTRLPYSIQRTLSVLPIKVDPLVQVDAQYSTDWRLDIWRLVAPMIPQYLLIGKGYSIDQEQLQVTQDLVLRGEASTYEFSLLAGDYHSGPLTLIIPLGMFGALAALWFFCAALRVLWLNCKWSTPGLLVVNRFILASFVVSLLYYLIVFGSFYSDFMHFAGLAGLSVSINGGVRRPATVPSPVPVPARPSASPALIPAPSAAQSAPGLV